jgi:hypothetical protein
MVRNYENDRLCYVFSVMSIKPTSNDGQRLSTLQSQAETQLELLSKVAEDNYETGNYVELKSLVEYMQHALLLVSRIVL